MSVTPAGLLAAVLAGLAGWAVYILKHPETRMAATTPVRRKKRHFRIEATKPPFEIELELREDGTPIPEGEEPEWMPLRGIQELPGYDGFELVRIAQTDPQQALRILVGEDNWPRFWAEYRNETFGSLQRLMNEAIEHSTGTSAGNS